ncbi:hypothetical protein RJ639_005270, partial [Escallonia herrerae]
MEGGISGTRFAVKIVEEWRFVVPENRNDSNSAQNFNPSASVEGLENVNNLGIKFKFMSSLVIPESLRFSSVVSVLRGRPASDVRRPNLPATSGDEERHRQTSPSFSHSSYSRRVRLLGYSRLPWVYARVQIKGRLEKMVKLIKEPICLTTTKASLLAIYHLVSSPLADEKVIARFVEMGLVKMLLEMLVDCKRSLCEKKPYDNVLTTGWKLSKNEKKEERGVLAEVLQVGAIQKLLLLLQVACSETTRGKATELWKLLNLHREGLECIDSMDFNKNFKRPFLNRGKKITRNNQFRE